MPEEMQETNRLAGKNGGITLSGDNGGGNVGTERMTGRSREEMLLARPAVPALEKWKLRAWRLVSGTGANTLLVGVGLAIAILPGAICFGLGAGIASLGPD